MYVCVRVCVCVLLCVRVFASCAFAILCVCVCVYVRVHEGRGQLMPLCVFVCVCVSTQVSLYCDYVREYMLARGTAMSQLDQAIVQHTPSAALRQYNGYSVQVRLGARTRDACDTVHLHRTHGTRHIRTASQTVRT